MGELSIDLTLKSVAVNEKKATSAPEISAEQIRSTSKITILIIWVLFKSEITNKLGGSISKIFRLV